jgi:flagellar protein FlaG
MDTNLNVQAVHVGYAKSPAKAPQQAVVPNLVASTSANSGKFSPAGGKALPQNDESAKSGQAKMANPNAAPKEEATELSRLAVALVEEFDGNDKIEKIAQAAAKLNEILRDRERDLEFTVDDVTGRTVLKVIHAESGEIIRQIPPEELLNIARAFIEGTGSLIEEQA